MKHLLILITIGLALTSCSKEQMHEGLDPASIPVRTCKCEAPPHIKYGSTQETNSILHLYSVVLNNAGFGVNRDTTVRFIFEGASTTLDGKCNSTTVSSQKDSNYNIYAFNSDEEKFMLTGLKNRASDPVYRSHFIESCVTN